MRAPLYRVLLPGLLLAHPVLAEGPARPAPALEATLLRTVNLPWQQPELILAPAEDITRLRVRVRAAGKLVATRELSDLRAGKAAAVTWKAPVGVHAYDVHLEGQAHGATFRQRVVGSVDVRAALALHHSPADVNLRARSLALSASESAAFGELTLYDMDGRTLHREQLDFGGAPAGSRLEVRWPETERAVARIDLRVFTTADSWADLQWQPIQVELGGEPILFSDSGWALAASEVEKLERAVSAAKSAVRELDGAPDLGLYLLSASGQGAELTARRAASVARFFRRGGLRVPVRFAVVDEPASAGAEVSCILATAPPVHGAWQIVR